MSERWEFHIGDDYAVVMRDGETTDTAFIRLYGSAETIERLGPVVAAAPHLLAALELAMRALGHLMPFWGNLSSAEQLSDINLADARGAAALAKAKGA